MTGLPQDPTAYGAQLRLVVDLARARAPAAFGPEAFRLIEGLDALPEGAADRLGRLTRRRAAHWDQWACGRHEAALTAAGWIEEADAPDRRRLTTAAGRLCRAALWLASGSRSFDWSVLVRLALGQLQAPPGSPLARSLAGAPSPSSWPGDAADLAACLALGDRAPLPPARSPRPADRDPGGPHLRGVVARPAGHRPSGGLLAGGGLRCRRMAASSPGGGRGGGEPAAALRPGIPPVIVGGHAAAPARPSPWIDSAYGRPG